MIQKQEMSNIFHFNRRARCGFTLVEILVVVSIISIFLALTIPAMKGLQRQAKSSKCISNLRNLGNGVFVYVAENDGSLPYMRDFSSGGAWSGPYWTDLIEPFVGAESSKAASERGQKTVFYCPGEDNTHVISDYGANPLVFLHPTTEARSLLMTRIEDQPGTLLLADAQILRNDGPIGSWHIASNWYNPDIPEVAPSAISGVSPRHGNTLNALFADGHVESLTYEAFREKGRRIFTPQKD